jgi:hypothetical protein
MGWRFPSTRIFCLVEIGFILFGLGIIRLRRSLCEVWNMMNSKKLR